MYFIDKQNQKMSRIKGHINILGKAEELQLILHI